MSYYKKRVSYMLKRKLRETQSEPQTIMQRPMWRFFGMLGDYFILTVYWLIGCLPIVTIGCSTTAIFYVFLKKQRREEGTLWQMYKKSFKENLRQGIFLWLLYVFIALDACIIASMLIRSGCCTAADFENGGRLFAPTVVCGLIYFSVMLYSAALLALFRQTTAQLLTAAIGLAFGNILSTLLFLLITFAVGFVMLYIFPTLAFIALPLAINLISLRMNAIFNVRLKATTAVNANV